MSADQERRAVLRMGAFLPLMLTLPVQAHALLPATSPVEMMRPFLGRWTGASKGEIARSYEVAPDGRSVIERNIAALHEDHGLFTWDDIGDRLVLRQRHIQGFVVDYAAVATRNALVLESGAIASLPDDFRARATYRFDGPDAFEELFETAWPGSRFTIASQSRFERLA